MKTTTLPQTLHDQSNLNAAPAADKSAVRRVFKLGLDVDLRNCVAAIQCDRGVIPPAQKFSRAQLVAWVRAKPLTQLVRVKRKRLKV